MISSCTPFGINSNQTNIPKDVKDSDWFYDYVAAAIQLEIVEGYNDNTFKPGKETSRIEAIKMMAVISGIEKASAECEEKPFVDVSEDHWGYSISRDAYCSGIVAGKTIKGKRYLFPDVEIKRKELATLIYNYYVTETKNFTSEEVVEKVLR